MPAHAPSAQPIKEEPWSDEQANSDWKCDPTSVVNWTPKNQTMHVFMGDDARAVVGKGNIGTAPDDPVLSSVFPNGGPVQVASHGYTSYRQCIGPSGQSVESPHPSTDHHNPIAVLTSLNEGDGGGGNSVFNIGVSFSTRRTSSAIPPIIPFGESASSVPMRFSQQLQSTVLTAPLTPGTPSSYTEEETRSCGPVHTSQSILSPPGNRRLSVNSLLSTPSDSVYDARGRSLSTTTHISVPPQPAYPLLVSSGTMYFYGYDLGQVDKDLGKNDDPNAISRVPPTPLTPQKQTQGHCRNTSWEPHNVLFFDFWLRNKSQRYLSKHSGYYKEPVAIQIPRSLGALPQKLVP